MLLELKMYILAFFLKSAIAGISFLLLLFILTSFSSQTLRDQEKVKTHVPKERSNSNKIIHSDTPALPNTDIPWNKDNCLKLFGPFSLSTRVRSCACTLPTQ